MSSQRSQSITSQVIYENFVSIIFNKLRGWKQIKNHFSSFPFLAFNSSSIPKKKNYGNNKSDTFHKVQLKLSFFNFSVLFYLSLSLTHSLKLFCFHHSIIFFWLRCLCFFLSPSHSLSFHCRCSSFAHI